MKTKTDIYTKIMLTAVVVLLTAHLVKDINFVTTTQANELDISALKIEQTTDDEGTTFFIYENSKLERAFSKDRVDGKECEIKPDDIPTYIITNKKVKESPLGSNYTKIRRD